jgi:WD40 repeat protein
MTPLRTTLRQRTGCPYPGLRPFERDEADLFFGRDEQIAQILERLDEARFLAVVGASGCGKSSLVYAGIIPALKTYVEITSGSHLVVVALRPGDQPLRALARALLGAVDPARADTESAVSFLEADLRRGPLALIEALELTPPPEGSHLLFLVDQFEEIFRYRERVDRDEADAFVALLLTMARRTEVPAHVVLTMRSDYLGDCAVFTGLPEAISTSQYLTPRMSRNQRRKAIEGPALAAGGRVETDLVNRLLNDMDSGPDQLPLMQHALMRLWRRSEESRRAQAGDNNGPVEIALKLEDYDSVGGLARALSDHATEIYLNDLDERQQHITTVMFRGLTERGEGNRDTRRPAPLGQLARIAGAELDEVRGVVEVFRRSDRRFLMPPPDVALEPETMLDISHESLIRQWDLLRGWVEAEAQSTAMYRRLSETATLWKGGQAALWSSPDLENALAWRVREQPTRTWAERYGGNFADALEFLDASIEAREARAQAEQEIRDRELAFLKERGENERRLHDLETNRRIEAEEFSKQQTQMANSLRRWLYVAIASATAALLFAFVTLWYFTDAQRERHSALQARNASRQASYNIQLARASDHRIKDPDLARHLLYDTSQCPPELRCFTWGYYNRLIHLQSKSARQILRPGAGAAQSVAYSPDGKLVASSHRDGSVRLWDSVTGRSVNKILAHKGPAYSVAFASWDPDPLGSAAAGGKFLLVSGGSDGAIRLWDPVTGTPKGEPIVVPGRVDCIRIYSQYGLNLLCTVEGSLSYFSSTDLRSWKKEEGSALKRADKRLRFLELDDWGAYYSPTYVLVYINDRSAYLFKENRYVYNAPLTRSHEPTLLEGSVHDGEITAIAVSRTTHRLATSSRDRTIKLWNLESSRFERTLEGHLGAVTSIAFSPDGRYLASGSEDNSVKLWDVLTGEFETSLGDHPLKVTGVAFSPDGKTVASVGEEGTVRLWNVAVSPQRATLAGNKGPTAALAFSPDGKRLVSAGGDRIIRFWDVAKGVAVSASPVQPSYVLCLAYTPDGRTVASAGDDTAIDLRSAATGKIIRTITAPGGHTEAVRWLAVAPDGKRIASASGDGTVKTWDLASGKLLRTLRGHHRYVNSVDYSPDGRQLATGGYDSTVRLWDAESGEQQKLLGEHPRSQVLSVRFITTAGSTKLVSSSGVIQEKGENSIKVWDVETGELVRTLEGHMRYVRRLAASPDGKVLASAGADRRIRLWDLAIGFEQPAIDPGFGDVLSVTFSPDGNTLAASGSSGPIKLWDSVRIAIGLQTDENPDLDRCCWGVSASPDGKTICAVGESGTIQLLSSSDLKPRLKVEDGPLPLLACTFSPDGKRLATGGADGLVRIRDAESGSLLTTFRPEGGAVRHVAFSPEGGWLASAGSDGMVRIWGSAPATGSAPLVTLRGHASFVNSVAFARDGQTVASASYDGTVRIWDVRTGTERLRFAGTAGSQVLCVDYAPDGERLAAAGGEIRAGGSTSGDNDIWLWDTRTRGLIGRLRGHAGPCVGFDSLRTASNWLR